MERNTIVKVDIFDNEIGEIEKMEAHFKPVLHRAFSVFIVNDKNEMLIQKRAEHKYHSAGLWANACCSHPRSGENVIESAKERMVDEIGIVCNLEELFSFNYLSKYNENLYEYEVDHVLLGKYNGEVSLNKEEASEFRWVDVDSLAKEMLEEPQKFATWFITSAPRVISLLKLNK